MSEIEIPLPKTVGEPAATSALVPARGRKARRLIGDPRAWIVAAMIGDGLLWLSPGDEASPLRFLDPLLLALGLALYVADDRFSFRSRVRLSRPVAAVAFVAAGVLAGLVYELTLATGGDGYGGLHRDTTLSFLLFPGYYVTASVLALVLVSRLRLDRRRTFFVGASFAVFEVATVGLPALISPLFFLAPFVIAYYAVVYSLIITFGILLIPEGLLHGPSPSTRPVGLRRALALGVGAGLVSWVSFILWAGLLAALGADVF